MGPITSVFQICMHYTCHHFSYMVSEIFTSAATTLQSLHVHENVIHEHHAKASQYYEVL